jgi:tRNA pseudouridine(55) synthase
MMKRTIDIGGGRMRTVAKAAAANNAATTTSTSSSPTTSSSSQPPLYLAEGLFAVIKPLTWSSNDVVSYIRGILIRDAKERGVTDSDDHDDNTTPRKKKKKWTGRRKNQLMKVGHGGTLDPLASGVLVIGVGKGTTMLQHYLQGDKHYVASVQLGYETTTLDCEGSIVKTAPYEHILDNIQGMENSIKTKFTGTIQQVPPLYSAIRVGGQRLYDIARPSSSSSSSTTGVAITKAEDVVIPTREVEIYNINVSSTFNNDVLYSGMVDGVRYRELASIMEEKAVVEAAAAAATAAVDVSSSNNNDNNADIGNKVEQGGGGGKGEGTGNKKRKRGAGTNKDSSSSSSNNHKNLFDEVTIPAILPSSNDGNFATPTTTGTTLTMPQFALSVECGGGTYIRSLVRDIGYELGTVATMTGLVRTKQGPFVLGDALIKQEWTADAIYNAIRKRKEVDDTAETTTTSSTTTTTMIGNGDNDDTTAVLDIRGGGVEFWKDQEPPLSGTVINRFYPIGIPGKPWTDVERAQWKANMKVQRKYKNDVLDVLDSKIDKTLWKIVKYGELSYNPSRYPLFVVQSQQWQVDKPCMLITGGVHGYETSGVHGALLFLQSTTVKEYMKNINLVVVPCVSPWSYEHIQRWNINCKDVNRSFKQGSETEESSALLSYLRTLNDVQKWTCHIDLHETTDSDETEFRRAKAAEAGLLYEPGGIPDGFYLAGDIENSQLDFQEAIITSVRSVSHIAPPDNMGNIIGVPVIKEGVLLIPAKSLGLCSSAVDATYSTTTEVYPDSTRATDEICNRAQIAAIVGAIDYVLSNPH